MVRLDDHQGGFDARARIISGEISAWVFEIVARGLGLTKLGYRDFVIYRFRDWFILLFCNYYFSILYRFCMSFMIYVDSMLDQYRF